jgi:hypothetical protein
MQYLLDEPGPRPAQRAGAEPHGNGDGERRVDVALVEVLALDERVVKQQVDGHAEHLHDRERQCGRAELIGREQPGEDHQAYQGQAGEREALERGPDQSFCDYP